MALTVDEAALNIHRLITETLIELAVTDEEAEEMTDDEYDDLAESLAYAADLILQTIGLQLHEVDGGNPEDGIWVCTVNANPLSSWADTDAADAPTDDRTSDSAPGPDPFE